ncbi:hypothetical protein BMS3Abin16_00145 [archaeon BMS3Abin16]|nr:hypothetical protein BMS3Abin16_00145 [archaeon BMS3Abin16]
MTRRSLFLVFALFAALFLLPGVSAQAVVSSHNISFELREGYVNVVETLVFLNPVKSDVHTFSVDQTLIRRGAREIEVTGMPSSVGADSDAITLLFSKSPIFRTAIENSKTVVISYKTDVLTSEQILDHGERTYLFTGSILPPIPAGLEAGDTFLFISTGEGLEFGPVLPEAEINNGTIRYFVSAEERSTYPAFNVKIQYAAFETLALANIKSAKNTLATAEERVKDADFAISNAGVYGANTSNAKQTLAEAQGLINESKGYITVAQTILKSGETYDAYLLTNTSVNMAGAALQKASDSMREANLQLSLFQQALNEKISQLENMTTPTEPVPTESPAPTETPLPINQTTTPPLTPAPEPTALPPGLTLPLAPPAETQQASDTRISLTLIGVMAMILIIVGATVAVSGRRRRPKPKHPVMTDFRSISDLKKKSYKDFEEKVVDVKKETNIAGEIRRLRAGKRKFELGIENLNKKEVSGEINEKLYKTERRRFESEIKKLEKKIKSLEAQLPTKGGFDGQSNSDKDRPK